MSSSYAPSLQMLEEKAKQDAWNMLSNEQRQSLRHQAASQLPSNMTQPRMIQQTPRTMPSNSGMTPFMPADIAITMERNHSALSFDHSAPSYSTYSQRSVSATHPWDSNPQDIADYTFTSAPPTRRPSNLQSIPEASTYTTNSLVELSPTDYLNSYHEHAPPSPLPHHPYQHMQLTTTMPSSSFSDGSTSPATSATTLMTPITPWSNPMSRQSSSNPPFPDSASMSRVQSDSSCIISYPSGDETFSLPLNNYVDLSFSSATFTEPISENFLSVTQPLTANAQAFVSSDLDKSYLGEDMRRSTSVTSSEGNASDASASSSSSRSSRRQSEINAQASRKIAPKAIETNDETKSLSSNVSMTRIRSEDGSSKTVGVITKTPYVRPHHPKIMCQHCSERPEGFRGTHELDRHIARAHNPRRKAYICIDASPDKKFLANCKHCRNKKVYGAYYNAAAHLRRAHFHPRKRGRKGKNDEKRGGIGGGDDPPMDYLKQNWIKEVEVDNTPTLSLSSASDDDAGEPTEANYDMEYETESFPVQQAMVDAVPQISNDVHQPIEYGMSMVPTEPMMYDPNSFVVVDHTINPMNNFNNFQFDAYQ